MSKVAASLAGMVLVSGASITGAYALGVFRSGIEIPQTLDEIKEWDGGVCVWNSFSGVNKLGSIAADATQTSSILPLSLLNRSNLKVVW